jgi:hypothetical protein
VVAVGGRHYLTAASTSLFQSPERKASVSVSRRSPDVVGEPDQNSFVLLVRIHANRLGLEAGLFWCKFAGAAGPAAALRQLLRKNAMSWGQCASSKPVVRPWFHGSTVPIADAALISHARVSPCRGCCDDAPGQGSYQPGGRTPAVPSPPANQRATGNSAYLSWHLLLLQPNARPELNVQFLPSSRPHSAATSAT